MRSWPALLKVYSVVEIIDLDEDEREIGEMHVQHRTLSTSSEHLLKPDLKLPHLLEDIIKQLWPEWTEDEYRPYYSSLDKLGVPSCWPSEHVQAMVEGTALGFQ